MSRRLRERRNRRHDAFREAQQTVEQNRFDRLERAIESVLDMSPDAFAMLRDLAELAEPHRAVSSILRQGRGA